MKENINIKERNFDILSMWKDFWNPTPEEVTDEESLLADKRISEEDKKELIKALKNTDKLGENLFKTSYKIAKLKVKPSDGIKKSLKQKGTSKKAEQKGVEQNIIEKEER